MQVSVKQKRKTRAASALALAASTAVAISSRSATADTPASWLSETSGNWTDPTQWSTNPNYPNNGTPAGTNYDAYISATGGTAYTVTLNSNITVNSLTLNSADATLNQTGGTLSAGSINLSSGTYQLNNGTISGGTINVSGGTFTTIGGTLNGVSVVGGNLTFGGNAFGSLTIDNGLSTQPGYLLNVDPLYYPNAVIFDGPSQTLNSLTLSGSPPEYNNYGNEQNIDVSGTNSGGSTTLTLGSGSTFEGALNIQNGSFSNSTLVNNGLLNSNGQNLTVSTSYFINNATAEATAGGSLNISSTNLTNNGTLESLAGSTLTISSANFVDNGTLITQGAIQTTGGLTVLNNTVTLTSGLLQTGSSGSLAVSGTSAINQSGTSTANVEGPLVLAPLAGDQASYNLSSGTVTCQQYAAIGANGIGVFTQTGGTTTVDGIFAVGNSGTLGAGTGVGSANISGGHFHLWHRASGLHRRRLWRGHDQRHREFHHRRRSTSERYDRQRRHGDGARSDAAGE